MTIERPSLPTHAFMSFDPDELALELGGDVAARAAAMALIASKHGRDAASEARQAEEQRLAAQQEAQIEHMHDQAEAMRAAAWAQAGAQLIGAGLDFAGGMSTDLSAKVAAQAASKGTEALGNLSASGHRFDGAIAEAAAVRSGQLASATERRLDDLQTATQEASDLRREAIEFFRSAGQIETATEQAIFVRG